MGQYYRPCFLNEAKTRPTSFAISYDFANGAKLMEHSWMKNPFVAFIEKQMMDDPKRLVWAGDYADGIPFETLSKAEQTIIRKDYSGSSPKTVTLYALSGLTAKLIYTEELKDKYNHTFPSTPKQYKYLINYDKKEFVDKSKVPSNDGWQIHPLPLLTCEGNGRGGGDFHGNEGELVGRWARDLIKVSSKKSDIPKGFKEIIFDLKE